MRRALLFVLLVFITLGTSACSGPPKNVILFIGDGMGFEHVKATGMYANGEAGTLCFEKFNHKAHMTTYSANNEITDSAAAGTAMATGHKVNNHVISMAIPGDGSELDTMLEYFKSRGKSVGLVTTTPMTHATPAVFAAHEPTRNNLKEIADDYITQTRPDVLFGGGGQGMSPDATRQAGYTVVTTVEEFSSLNTEDAEMVCGLFSKDVIPYKLDGISPLPPLAQMTSKALNILDNNPNGFFLMVEGGRIDWAGHANDLDGVVQETVEFDKAIAQMLEWAKGRSDTLVIVTADHETGGLAVVKNNGKGNLPDVTWSTGNHTATKVPAYAIGPNAEMVTDTIDNTDIFEIATAKTPVLQYLSN